MSCFLHILFIFCILTSSYTLGNKLYQSINKLNDSGAQITLKSCGVSKISSNSGDRIVGGRKALQGEFPWQISLQYKSSVIKPTHLCGGAILNANYIITAAHCVAGRSAQNFEVAIGLHKLNDRRRTFPSYQVSQIIVHEGFDRESFRNDIALLKLEQPILFSRSNNFINGICLSEPNQTFSGFATATGWGDTKEDGDGSNVLLAVELPLIPQFICEFLYGKMFFPEMICAGEPTGGLDTCQGDSGGPLFQKDRAGKNILIGIVSWGIGCARPLLPGIYTSVSHYIDWIVENVR